MHKFERPSTPTGLPNNGTAVDTSALTPLAGIGFTVQQVNALDLSTNAGWESAHNLSTVFSAADPEGSITGAGFTLGTGQTQVTDAAGTAAFTSLPVGLYLVTETSYPASVTPSAPFLVSVPLTDPNTTDNWLYDVHVYPGRIR
ncbi:SpaH/EbpB family LPXTG-anchored major pilin [Arthrobacter sp. SA17]